MSEWTSEPLSLSDLNGATLTYEDGDGNEVTVEFNDD